jgi:hypothetical protein
MTLTVGLYPKPKQFVDMDRAIGEVISSRMDKWREEQIGSGQTWYYHDDQIPVSRECFLYEFVRQEPLGTDQNMRALWTSVEQWLVRQFPKAQDEPLSYLAAFL